MIKKILTHSLLACLILLPTVSTAALSLEQPKSNPSIQLARVELDAELRQQSNLPFLRDKNNKPLTGDTEGTFEYKAKTLIGNIVSLTLRFLIGLSVIFIILNGYKFMTAAGDESKIGEAKKSLLVLIGGLLIIMLSYSIVSFVFKSVLFIEDIGDIKTETS